MVKDVQIYFIRLKNDLFGCFRIEKIRDQDNETDLKEERVIQIETIVLPFTITIITIYYSDTINISKLEKNNFHDNYNLVLKLQWFPYTRCTLSFAFVFTYHP